MTLPFVVGSKWSWYPQVPTFVNVKLYESPLLSVEESSPGRSVCVGCGSDDTRTSPPELFVQVTTAPVFTVTVLGDAPDEVIIIAVAVLVFTFATAFVLLFTSGFVFTFWFNPITVFVGSFTKSIMAIFVLLFVAGVQAASTIGSMTAPAR